MLSCCIEKCQVVGAPQTVRPNERQQPTSQRKATSKEESARVKAATSLDNVRERGHSHRSHARIIALTTPRSTEGIRWILYEYQARQMFKEHGVPVLDYRLASTPRSA